MTPIELTERCAKVLASCKTKGQRKVAINYIILAAKKLYPAGLYWSRSAFVINMVFRSSLMMNIIKMEKEKENEDEK